MSLLMLLDGPGKRLFADRLIDQLQPWMTPDLERYCYAIGVMFQPVFELVEEEGTDGEYGYVPPWGILFDPDLCPARYLPYLGQFVGVEIPQGASEEEARALVKAESGRERGTLQAVESAIRRNLAPGATFQIVERRNLADEEDAYHFVVTIKGKGIIQTWFKMSGSWESLSGSWENLAGSEGLVKEAVNRVKPGGVFYSIILAEGTPWLDLAGSWESLTGTWEHQ